MIQRYYELVDDLRDNSNCTRFREDLKSLLEDTKAHFRHEERVMRNIEYPDYREHLAAHKQLSSDISDFIQSIGAGLSDEDLPALTQYFRHWFVTHIQEYDVKLKQYLDRNE
jgi:hemerythrin